MKLRLVFAYMWVVAPVIAVACHYAWGIPYLRQDRFWDDIQVAAELEEAAMEAMTVEALAEAEDAYSDIIERFDERDPSSLQAQVVLARARCTLYKGELVPAMLDLEAQLDNCVRMGVPQDIQRDIRETLARCLFGIAWLMRHEGASQENWMEVADKARQHFRYLTEVAPNEEERERCAKNLQVAIRLEQIDSTHPWLRKLRMQEAVPADVARRNSTW